MVVELLEKGGVNIKGLMLPEVTEGKLNFDPNKDISEANWKRLTDELYLNRFAHPWISQFATLAACVKIVAPERFTGVVLVDEARQTILENLMGTRHSDRNSSERWQKAPHQIFEYITLFSHGITDIYPREWQMMEELGDFRDYFINKEKPKSPWVIASLEIWSERNFSYKGEEQFLQREVLPYLNESLAKARRVWDTNAVAEALASLRILDQEKFSKVRLTGREWQNMREELDWHFRGESLLFKTGLAPLLLHMSIISAKEVKIKNRQLELVMPESGSLTPEPVSNLPQIRRF